MRFVSAICIGRIFCPRGTHRRREKQDCSSAWAASTRRWVPIAIFNEYTGYAERLKPFVGDTTHYLHDAVEAGKKVLFEGRKVRCSTLTTARFPMSPAATPRASAFPAGPACRGKWITKVDRRGQSV